MEIGKPIRTIRVEPAKDPVPQRERTVPAKRPTKPPVPRKEPDKAPERPTPKKVPAE
jgi:hypothetical protein